MDRRRRRLAAPIALVAAALSGQPAGTARAAEAPLTVRLDASAVGVRTVDAAVRSVDDGRVELRAAMAETTRAGTSDLWLLVSGEAGSVSVAERAVRRAGSAGVLTAPESSSSPVLLRVTGQEAQRMYTGTSTVRATLTWDTDSAAARRVLLTLLQ